MLANLFNRRHLYFLKCFYTDVGHFFLNMYEENTASHKHIVRKKEEYFSCFS